MTRRETLTESLAELERTNPEVRRAAEKYDATVAALIEQPMLPMGPRISRPAVRLASGNGYAILMKCIEAADKAGWSLREWRAFSRKFRAGTWEEAFQLVTEHFEVACLPSFSKDPTNWRTDGAQTNDD